MIASPVAGNCFSCSLCANKQNKEHTLLKDLTGFWFFSLPKSNKVQCQSSPCKILTNLSWQTKLDRKTEETIFRLIRQLTIFQFRLNHFSINFSLTDPPSFCPHHTYIPTRHFFLPVRYPYFLFSFTPVPSYFPESPVSLPFWDNIFLSSVLQPYFQKGFPFSTIFRSFSSENTLPVFWTYVRCERSVRNRNTNQTSVVEPEVPKSSDWNNSILKLDLFSEPRCYHDFWMWCLEKAKNNEADIKTYFTTYYCYFIHYYSQIFK